MSDPWATEGNEGTGDEEEEGKPTEVGESGFGRSTGAEDDDTKADLEEPAWSGGGVLGGECSLANSDTDRGRLLVVADLALSGEVIRSLESGSAPGGRPRRGGDLTLGERGGASLSESCPTGVGTVMERNVSTSRDLSNLSRPC